MLLRRFLYKPYVTCGIHESVLIKCSSAHYSSENTSDPPKDKSKRRKDNAPGGKQTSSRKKIGENKENAESNKEGKRSKSWLHATLSIASAKPPRKTLKASPLKQSELDELTKKSTENVLSAKAKPRKIERPQKSAWTLNPKEFDSAVRKAATNVAVQAGEAQETVEGDLLKFLDDTSSRKERYKKEHQMRKKSDIETSISSALDSVAPLRNHEKFFDDQQLKNQKHEKSLTSIRSIKDMLSLPPLGLFGSAKKDQGPELEFSQSESFLQTWDALQKRELHLTVNAYPRNWWDQCVQWTEQGQLWHFPINNEQGMDEEAEVSFTEHVFLDKYLEGWCPTQGPIQHFMELVLVGLSKNPYLSVQEKRETIEWYRDYFEKHRTLLQEINALGSAPLEVSQIPKVEA